MILAKQKKFLIKLLKQHKVGSKRLRNEKLVKSVLVEALMKNDLETFQDVLITHLNANPKSRLAQTTGLGRQTLYDLVNEDKEFNPTLKTLGAILQTFSTA